MIINENKEKSMSDEAVYHHLIPQTYMKPWCFSGKTVFAYDKRTGCWDERNIENICGINYYHSIRANSLYFTQDALEKIFGFLSIYNISYNGVSLNTLEDMHHNYQYYDEWEIRYPKGALVSKKKRNIFKTQIQQAKFNDVEEQWSEKFENGWETLIREIELVLLAIKNRVPIKLTRHAFSELVKYYVMFEWRGFGGNLEYSDAFNKIDKIFPFSSVEIPEEERTLPIYSNVLEEMKHNLLIKYFDLFQDGKGVIQTYKQILEDNCTAVFLIAPQDSNFLTSDNPCFRFKNENDEMVPFFVALPQLAIILPKKDSESPNEYCINELSLDEMKYYNKQILVNSKNLILNNSQMDINELM